jgi:hypothetical protein
MRVQFYGGSDDLIYVEGALVGNGPDKGTDMAEFNARGGDRDWLMGTFEIHGPAESCDCCGAPKPPVVLAIVFAFYTNLGTWVFAPSLKDERKMPWPKGWTIDTKQHPEERHGHSMLLTIDTGDVDVSVVMQGADEE